MKDNQISIEGNLTGTPELRHTPSGLAVTTITVAHNSRLMNDKGEWVDGDTTFVDVVCWARLAQHVAASCETGTRIMVSGRLNQRSWTDPATNQKRYKLEVVADSVGISLTFAPARSLKVAAVEGVKARVMVPAGAAPGLDEEPF